MAIAYLSPWRLRCGAFGGSIGLDLWQLHISLRGGFVVVHSGGLLGWIYGNCISLSVAASLWCIRGVYWAGSMAIAYLSPWRLRCGAFGGSIGLDLWQLH